MRKLLSLIPGAAALFTPISSAFAHEVYILSGNQIATDVNEPPFDMVAVALANLPQFIFWGCIAGGVVLAVFAIAMYKPLQRAMSPLFEKNHSFAPAISRITIGLGLIAAAYFQATFGPELPLSENFGSYAHIVSVTLIIIGTLIIVGFWARAAAIVALGIFGIVAYKNGWYLLTYTNYLGEIIVLLLLGSHRLSVHSFTGWEEKFHSFYHAIADKVAPYAFAILRVCFGISLIYSSVYAKIIHNNLALQIASLPLAEHPYSIAHYFGMEPHFLVVGAAIIEVLVGVCFVLGIHIRFVSIFLLFWLMMSLWYFGESVWPHIILIGIPIAFLFHGYDRYSVEGFFFKKGKLEPVL